MSNKLIFGLDVGSSKIVSLVGSLGEKIQILGLSNYHFVNNSRHNDFTMLSNGLICEVERIGYKITQVLHEAQINADCSAGSVITNVSGNHVRNIYSHSSQEINGHPVNEDILRYMINEACQISIPKAFEILDYEVQEYLIDEDRYAVNPLALNCNSINTNVNVFIAGATPLANLKKSISYSNYAINKIVPSAILSAMAVLNREEKELGCCLIDIGAGTTDIVVYENGFIRFVGSIPLGGEDITRDIASIMRLSRNLAEDLKVTYGSCGNSSRAKHGDAIAIADHRGENRQIAYKLLNDVISARLKDIFDVIKTQLNKQDLYGIINSGIVITGGGALLTNLKDFAGQYFNLPVKIGVPEYEGDFAEIICNPRYATSVGAIYFANNLLIDKNFGSEFNSVFNFGQLIKRVQNIFKNV